MVDASPASLVCAVWATLASDEPFEARLQVRASWLAAHVGTDPSRALAWTATSERLPGLANAVYQRARYCLLAVGDLNTLADHWYHQGGAHGPCSATSKREQTCGDTFASSKSRAALCVIFPNHWCYHLIPRCLIECCTTVYSEKALNPVQIWIPGLSAICRSARFGMLSIRHAFPPLPPSIHTSFSLIDPSSVSQNGLLSPFMAVSPAISMAPSDIYRTSIGHPL